MDEMLLMKLLSAVTAKLMTLSDRVARLEAASTTNEGTKATIAADANKLIEILTGAGKDGHVPPN